MCVRPLCRAPSPVGQWLQASSSLDSSWSTSQVPLQLPQLAPHLAHERVDLLARQDVAELACISLQQRPQQAPLLRPQLQADIPDFHLAQPARHQGHGNGARLWHRVDDLHHAVHGAAQQAVFHHAFQVIVHSHQLQARDVRQALTSSNLRTRAQALQCEQASAAASRRSHKDGTCSTGCGNSLEAPTVANEKPSVATNPATSVFRHSNSISSTFMVTSQMRRCSHQTNSSHVIQEELPEDRYQLWLKTL